MITGHVDSGWKEHLAYESNMKEASQRIQAFVDHEGVSEEIVEAILNDYGFTHDEWLDWCASRNEY